MLPVKNRCPNCDFRGGQRDITTFGFVTDTYIDRYIHTGVTETTYFASE